MLFDLLPEDRTLRVAGVPVRVLVPVLLGLFCVAVECVLYAWGGLAWAWSFWKWPNVLPIAVVYCLPFVLLVWVHDHATPRTRAIATASLIALAIAAHAVFAVALGWI